MTENKWRLTIAALSAAVVLLTVWCLVQGITIIFMHLYYFPIVLLAYRYRWKGFYYASLLALVYLILVSVFYPAPAEIAAAVFRVLVFCGIAAVIAALSEQLRTSRGSELQSRALNEQYLALAPAIVLVLDREGVITYLNENGCRILACEAGSAVGKSWVDTFIPPNEQDSVRAVFAGIMNDGSSQYGMVEGTVVSGRGDLRYIRWYNTLLRDADGAVNAILSFGEDITAEKRTQDALQKMHEFQKSVIENANIWIAVLAPDGTVLVWNKAAELISGYAGEAVTGKKMVWKQMYPDPEYRRGVTREIQGVLSRDTGLVDFETTIRCADETTKNIIWNTKSLRDTEGSVTSYIVIGRDITAQKDAEQKAGENARFLATMLDTLPMPVFYKDHEGRFLGCNPPFEEYFGIRKNDLVGKTVYDVAPREMADRYTQSDRQVFNPPGIQRYETQVQNADGTLHDVIFSKAPFFNKDGSVAGLIGAIIDISDQKKMETALRESEERILLLLNSAAEAIYGIDLNGNCTFCNKACLSLLGYAKESDLLMQNMHWKIHGSYADGTRFPLEKCRIFQAFQNGKGTHVDNEVLWRADGTAFPAEYWSYPQRDADGKVVGAVVTFLDITDRKRAEEALRASEQKYRTLFENMLEGFAYCRMIYDENDEPVDWVYLDVNRAFGNLTGLHDITGKRVLEAIPDIRKLTPELFAMYGRVASTGSPEMFEIDFKPLNSWLKVSAFCPEKGYFVAVFEDITQRKASQERIQALLKTKEEQLRIINTSPAVSFLWRAEENWPVESVSTNIAQFGYTPDDFLSGRIVFGTIIHPDDLARVGAEVSFNSTHAIDDYTQIYRFLGKDSTEYWIEDYTHIRRDESGRITHYEGLVLDISDRKRAEIALKETNDYLTSLFDYANAPIIVWDPSFNITRFNHAFEHLTGRTEQDVIGKPLAILFPDESREESLEQIRETLAGIRWESVEIPIIHVSGDVRTVLWNSATLYGEDGDTVIATIAQGQDITDRKLIEAKFQESRQLFMDIISFLPDPTFVIDKDGRVIAWNRAIEQLSGIPAAGMIGQGDYAYSTWVHGKRRPILIDLVLNPDKDSARIHYTDIRWEGSTVTAQLEVTLPGREKKVPLSLVASPLLDADGKVAGAIESMRDISRLKEAEEELERFNANLEKIIRDRTQALNDEIVQRKAAEREVADALHYSQSVIEANPDLMIILDEQGTVLDVNPAAESLTGLSRDELVGTSYSRYLVDDATPKDIFSRLLHDGRVEYTVNLGRADGHVTPVAVNSTIFRGENNADTRIIVAGHDISRQKENEAALQASLDEQVLLLREVHHRVKNNLQIIISLTNLQMRQSTDPRVKQIMAETQNRVRAMSLVHEKLYRSQSLSKIDFGDYSRFLATQLFGYYGMDTQRVQLQFAVEKIMVDIVTAVPLGLLMNELVSNAFRHAFPDGRSGVIGISGKCEADTITLTVRDNGVGIPPDLDWKNSHSLGLRLVNTLVDQVDGTIELDRSSGTSFTITARRPKGDGDTA